MLGTVHLVQKSIQRCIVHIICITCECPEKNIYGEENNTMYESQTQSAEDIFCNGCNGWFILNRCVKATDTTLRLKILVAFTHPTHPLPPSF